MWPDHLTRLRVKDALSCIALLRPGWIKPLDLWRLNIYGAQQSASIGSGLMAPRSSAED